MCLNHLRLRKNLILGLALGGTLLLCQFCESSPLKDFFLDNIICPGQPKCMNSLGLTKAHFFNEFTFNQKCYPALVAHQFVKLWKC